jgi:hypothetical protein
MLKPLLSIVAGLIAAFALVFVTDLLFHAVGPPPPTDPGAVADYVAALPVALLAGIALGWAVSALIGTTIAARFGARGAWPGWVVGLLFLAATAANFMLVRHPAWMMAFAVLAILAATWIGSRSGRRAG